MRLDEALNGILEASADLLREAAVVKGLLEGVTTVVRGDRARPTPRPPSIWIYPEGATPNHRAMSIREEWDLSLILVAQVQNDNPDEGYQQVTALAAKARSVMLRDRTLGMPELVRDVKSGRFEPSGPWHREGNMFGAGAVVVVTFITNE